MHLRNVGRRFLNLLRIKPKPLTAKRAVISSETAPAEVYFQSALEAINFDEVIQAKGVEQYQLMIKDPFVKTALMNKKAAVLSFPWSIVPASDDRRDIEIAKFIEFTIDDMEGMPENNLLNILDALDIGYSITEKNYKVIKKGKWKGKVGLKSLKGKDPATIELRVDDYNNLVGMATKNIGQHVELNPNKFVVFSYMPKYSSVYGTSDLRAAHRAFVIKETAWRGRAIYMQKFGNPTMIGKYKSNASDEDQDRLLSIMRSINEDTQITLPEDMEIEAFNVATSADNQYQNMISDLNQEILIGILGSFLMIMEGKETGARSIGEVHKDTAFTIVKFLALNLENVINEEVIKQMVDFNFAGVVQYPKYKIVAEVTANLNEEVSIITELAGVGLPISSSYLYKRFNIPRPKEGETLLGEVGQQFASHPVRTTPKINCDLEENKNRPECMDESPIEQTILRASDTITRFKNRLKSGEVKPTAIIDSLRDGILTAHLQGMVKDKNLVGPRYAITPQKAFETFRDRIDGLSKAEFTRIKKESIASAMLKINKYIEDPSITLEEVYRSSMEESLKSGLSERN